MPTNLNNRDEDQETDARKMVFITIVITLLFSGFLVWLAVKYASTYRALSDYKTDCAKKGWANPMALPAGGPCFNIPAYVTATVHNPSDGTRKDYKLDIALSDGLHETAWSISRVDGFSIAEIWHGQVTLVRKNKKVNVTDAFTYRNPFVILAFVKACIIVATPVLFLLIFCSCLVACIERDPKTGQLSLQARRGTAYWVGRWLTVVPVLAGIDILFFAFPKLLN